MARRDSGPGYRAPTDVAPAMSWPEHVGEQIQRARMELGWTQEDLASRMRLDGVPWRRSAVAAVEAGVRELTLSELFLVGDVLGVPMAALIADNMGRRTVAITDVVRANAGQIGTRITARPEQVNWVSLFIDQEAQKTALAELMGDFGDDALAKTWGATAEQALRAAAETTHEAVVKAAKALHRSATEIALAAQIVWGHSFVGERERRLRLRTGAQELSTRSRQAVRGRITRELLDELSQRLPKMDEGAQ